MAITQIELDTGGGAQVVSIQRPIPGDLFSDISAALGTDGEWGLSLTTGPYWDSQGAAAGEAASLVSVQGSLYITR